jgi:hypothetical protein
MAKVTSDHATIRKWAERHGGRPGAVDRTHQEGDVGVIRVMFPKAAQSAHGHLIEISSDEFFREFKQRDIAFLYKPDEMFSKIVGRDTAERREHGERRAAR